MHFSVFQFHFSAARMNRYLLAAGHSKRRAIKLYTFNLTLAQAFHPLLGIVEVVLRNQINDILTTHFADADWIINQKSGFMVDPSLQYVHKRTRRPVKNDFLKNEISKAEKRLRKSGITVTSGKIIAEQTLGFWTELFEPHHYKLLSGKPIQIFKSLPAGYNRKKVNQELDKIRRFRNRINHNEPICFSGNTLDLSNAIEVYNSIRSVISWIDPKLLTFLKDKDTVRMKLAEVP
jgi:hypothetical protein